MSTAVKSPKGASPIADPARAAALQLLCRAEEENKPPDEMIEALDESASDLDRRDLRFIRQLVAGVTKWRLHLDWILRPHSKRPLQELTPTVRQVLRLALFQIRWLDRVPDRAAVHSAVELTKHFEHRGAASYVNAVLRNLMRAVDEISYPDPATEPGKHLSIVHSHPQWLVERWLARWDYAQTEALLRANNQHPLLYAHRNGLRADHERFLENLPAGAHPKRVDDTTYEVSAPEGFFESVAFAEGQVYVQDIAATAAVRMLDPQQGDRMLDLCAAPGSKSVQAAIAAEDNIEIIACDRSASRLQLLRQSSRRLGLRSIHCVSSDGKRVALQSTDRGFDRVLIDAPCSGTGVFRRNADARWHKRAEDLTRHAQRQVDLLRTGFQHLRPGGTLVYSTCSLEPEENDDVVDTFLAQESAASLKVDTEWGARFESVPGRDDGDGSFAIRLQKDQHAC
ncbi:MAG: 16S rRNA (cytosine(967)-C(5))-methyltransferase RsmB [Gemmatimonadetes bacterium]|jgi:16S rRNA (cytosine967-C5)-methyltransferase|nr:16S rRNA (cytosine(967)-C(5))-methyltransferase RsmB [Gemmatimonadota bacterium]MBT5588785.1 16S rRNA (cytosine(967)-C(5))-methyltransferase RsmB [Gemmatimonadota bacterium]MBT5964497.1 16S rRNA (cytosine(967)-C(5))-methyltransferase RsmB [Gemmatimonadota bacterium]MBT7457593.1 16S rRNA (cytosine(967)-C(5))-methyltransferase RsmB [Gemmatimonadota bacterium]